MPPEAKDETETSRKTYQKPTPQHNEFLRVGIYLKESQGLTYRLRFEGHILQLQIKNPMTDQYHVVTAHEPAPVVNNMEDIGQDIPKLYLQTT